MFAAAEYDVRWRECAARLAAAPVTSVRAAKHTLRASGARTLAQCLDAEAAAQAACWASADSGEGLAAFADKRAARFGADAVISDEGPRSAAALRFE